MRYSGLWTFAVFSAIFFLIMALMQTESGSIVDTCDPNWLGVGRERDEDVSAGLYTLNEQESSLGEMSSSDYNTSSSAEESSIESTRTPLRKKKKLERSKRYLGGNARKPYHQSYTTTSDSTSLEGSFLQSSADEFPQSTSATSVTNRPDVCNSCAPVLEKYTSTFKNILRQGSELKSRKKVNPNPRKPNFQHYRDLVKQNEWLRNNIFDPMGNYLFCSRCVHGALGVAYQRLSRLRNIKKAQFSNPVQLMTKCAVEEAKLGDSVIMPSDCNQSFVQWWKSLDPDSQVSVRYPYQKHGLSGKSSNRAKHSVKEAFLRFVDMNSQPNGRQEDSSSATHFFLPKFKTIQTPKAGVHHFQERLEESVVGIFNQLQVEAGEATCSNGSASTWLRAERPKLKIYPHQADFCDTCARLKQELNGVQTSLKRKRQSGSATESEQKQLEQSISKLEETLTVHKAHANNAREYYNKMVTRCQEQWKEVHLSADSLTSSTGMNISELQHTFTLTLSADYQMSKLVPYWGHSPQPGSTYYLQKLSNDLFGIVDHKDNTSQVYVFDETIGPKNADHTFSYLIHYIKESGNVPPWVRRVHIFLDNAGSTNKNCYFMSAAMELVQQKVLDYIRVSFMVAGHTKFAPDRLFAKVAKTYLRSDVFTTQELAAVVSEYATVIVDDGSLVRTWRDIVGEKYTKLPGIRSLHDFLIVRHPVSADAIMKVREHCFKDSFQETTMKLVKGRTAAERAMPSIDDTYKKRGKVGQISSVKTHHLQQMYSSYVPVERHPNQ